MTDGTGHDGDASARTSRRALLGGVAVATSTAGCLGVFEDCQDCGGGMGPSFAVDYTAGATLDDHGTPWRDSDRDGVVTVTHESGDGAPAQDLFVEGTGLTTAGEGAWHDQAAADPGAAESSVTAGATTRVEADAAFTLRVRWEAVDGDGSELLAEHTRTERE